MVRRVLAVWVATFAPLVAIASAGDGEAPDVAQAAHDGQAVDIAQAVHGGDVPGGGDGSGSHRALAPMAAGPALPQAAWAMDAEAAPPSHGAADWGTRHGDGATGGDCAACHTVDACAACHAGQVDGPRPLHPAGYLMLHGLDAQRDGETCASCHGAGTFCAGCHAQAGVVQALAAPTASHHPDGWMSPGSPRGHARAARLDLASCATCHGERDCVACHQQVNPHGAAFVARCGDAMRASSTSCGQCHTLTSPVPMDAVRERCR